MPNKPFPRSRRIGDQIQRALSELIRREVKDPRLGMVTLTEVRVSKDLAYATVFYSVLGGDPDLAQEILEGAADYVRGPLGRALSLRHSPELRFTRDELIEKGARMSQLINTAVASDEARRTQSEDPETAPPGDEPDDRT
jgi:ribosome-binding factor A